MPGRNDSPGSATCSAAWRGRPSRRTREGRDPSLGRSTLIQSRTTRRFWRLFAELPPAAQQEAKCVYCLFLAPHPRLHFKKLEGQDDVYPAHIGLDYRALLWFTPSRECDNVLYHTYHKRGRKCFSSPPCGVSQIGRAHV